MALFGSPWKDRYNKKAQKVIEKGKKQKKLALIITNAPNYETRDGALEKLTDHDLLVGIAKNAALPVREHVVERLTDQDVLAYIAEHDSDHSVRSAAKNKLTD